MYSYFGWGVHSKYRCRRKFVQNCLISCGISKIGGDEAAPRYALLTKDEKVRYASLAKELNEAIAREKSAILAKLRDFELTGPLGSIEKRMFLDVDEVYELLNRPHSVLADLWKRTPSILGRDR